MKTTFFLSILITFLAAFSPCYLYSQSVVGGKPKQVINGPVRGGTPGKVARKTDNMTKKSVFRKSMAMLTSAPPSGAREKRQNKTVNKPKKYIRF
jgi:hypothetical protein